MARYEEGEKPENNLTLKDSEGATEVVNLAEMPKYGPSGCEHDWLQSPSIELPACTEYICRKCHWGFLARKA